MSDPVLLEAIRDDSVEIVELTRDEARELIDDIGGPEALLNAIDQAQGYAQNHGPQYVVLKISA